MNLINFLTLKFHQGPVFIDGMVNSTEGKLVGILQVEISCAQFHYSIILLLWGEAESANTHNKSAEVLVMSEV